MRNIRRVSSAGSHRPPSRFSKPSAAVLVVLLGTTTGCTEKMYEPAPSARYNAAGRFDSTGQVFHLVGGANGNGLLDDAWVLDFPHRQWVRVEGPSAPLLSSAATRTDDTVWVFGGSTTDRRETDGLVAWEVLGGPWIDEDAGAMRPAARREATLTTVSDGQAVLIGGNSDDSGDPGDTFGDVWGLDAAGPTWTEVETTGGPTGIQRHAAASDGSRIWIHGGVDETGTVVDRLWSLELDTWEWTEHVSATAGPSARADHLLAHNDGNLIVWGGGVEDDDIWVYTINTATWTAVTSPGPTARDAFAWDITEGSEWAVIIGGDPVQTSGYASDVWLLNLRTLVWEEILRLDESSF